MPTKKKLLLKHVEPVDWMAAVDALLSFADWVEENNLGCEEGVRRLLTVNPRTIIYPISHMWYDTDNNNMPSTFPRKLYPLLRGGKQDPPDLHGSSSRTYDSNLDAILDAARVLTETKQ